MRKASHSAILLAFLAWAAGWSVAGWALSAFRQLNGIGCALAAIAVIVLTVLGWRIGSSWKQAGGWIRPGRFRRNGWALMYAVLLGISILGGAWAEPGNIDALTYRFPKLFHWAAEGGWHWIDTANARINVTASGSEWLSLPAWIFFNDVRSSAWPNLLAFALLPGLVFSTLRAIGVHGRVARRWMWLLPTGYGYLLQAGSAGNDLLGAVYFLAAMDLAARARRTVIHRDCSLAGSVIAMALATGIKVSNAPLGLAWLVAVWPVKHRVLSPAVLAAVVIGIGASAIPTMVLNRWQTGEISGDPQNLAAAKPSSPAVALAGNAMLLTTQNLIPPVFPVAGKWNAWTESLIAGPLAPIRAGFPRFTLRAGELQQEEWAGLGIGLLLVAAYGRLRGPRRGAWKWNSAEGRCVLAAWIGLAVYSITVASEMPARLLLPYYPLLLGGVLARTHPRGGMNTRFGNVLAGATVVVAGAMLVLGPARPLWPWRATLDWLATKAPNSQLITRAKTVYSVYAERSDNLAAVRSALPPDAARIGFIGTPDDPEFSLWRPFGTRQLVTKQRLGDLHPEKTQLRYVVAKMSAPSDPVSQEFASEQADGKLELVAERVITVRASSEPETWRVWRWTQAP